MEEKINVKIPEWLAKAKELPNEFECAIKKDDKGQPVETKKAVLVIIYPSMTEMWLPKSQTKFIYD